MHTQKHQWLGGNQRISPTFCFWVAKRDQCPLRCFLGDSCWIKHDRTANLWMPQTRARLCHPPTRQQGGQLMSQWPQGQTPDGEKEGCRGHSSMTGSNELAFHSIKMFINIQTICHSDYDGVVLWETARVLKKDFSFCLLRQPQLKNETNNHNSEPRYHISQLCSPSHHLLWSTHTNLS